MPTDLSAELRAEIESLALPWLTEAIRRYSVCRAMSEVSGTLVRLCGRAHAEGREQAAADAEQEIRRLRAAVERLSPPHGDEGSTHWEGCWRTRGHHECAIAECERLREAEAEQSNALAHTMERLREAGRL